MPVGAFGKRGLLGDAMDEALPEPGLVHRPAQGSGESGGVARADMQPVDAVTHHLGHPADAADDRGATMLEGLLDDERRILGPGDAYYFESRRPHRFRCVGPVPCEVISACTPPTF